MLSVSSCRCYYYCCQYHLTDGKMPCQQQSWQADSGLFSLRHPSPYVSPETGNKGAPKLPAGALRVLGEMARVPTRLGPSLSRRAGGCRATGGSTWGHAHRMDARDPRACVRVQAVGWKKIGRIWSLILNLASPCVCRVALGKGLGFLICEMGKPRILMRER